MIKNNFKYREQEYANAIYTAGFQTSHIATEMGLLVLYMRDVLGYGAAKRKAELIRFCEEHIPGFDAIRDYRLLHRALKLGQEPQNLANVPGVSVYEKDIAYIRAQGLTLPYEKMMFTVLVFIRLEKQYREAKYGKPYECRIFGGASQVYSRIRNMANVDKKYTLYGDLVPELIDRGLALPQYRGRVSMEWMSECPEDGEPIGEVTDFDHVGYFYDRAIGDKKIRVCERCNSMYRSTANNQKYCTDCTKFRYNEYMAQYMRNHYQAKT